MSDEVFKSIAKQYGKDIVRSSSTILENRKQVLKISPSFDLSLGGVPEGSWVTLSGHSGCGKTTMALTIAAVAQLDNRPIFYLNAEGRLKPMNLEGIPGLDANKVNLIASTPDRHLTGEDYLNIGSQILKSIPNAVMILDSSSSLCPTDEVVGDVSGKTRSGNPKTLGSFCRKNAEVVSTMNSIVIIIKHLITNTSGYGRMYNEDGGVKLGYQADIRIMAIKNPEKWMEDDKQIGQIVEWEVVKSALGAPGNPFKTYLRYGGGVDIPAECAQLGEDYGIIDKSGAWYSFEIGEQKHKFQGKAKLVDALSKDSTLLDYVRKQISEISGV